MKPAYVLQSAGLPSPHTAFHLTINTKKITIVCLLFVLLSKSHHTLSILSRTHRLVHSDTFSVCIIFSSACIFSSFAHVHTSIHVSRFITFAYSSFRYHEHSERKVVTFSISRFKLSLRFSKCFLHNPLHPFLVTGL